MNVLVCDDERQIVDSIIETLEKKTEETQVSSRFYGFSQPSQIDLSLPYDIALLDIDMGETNGIELARKLRAENENIGSYLRKMALDGYCLNLDLPQLRRMAYLLQNCSNNLNQVAKRANESGQLYAADLEDLRSRLDELIAIGKQLLAKLSEL